MWFTKVVAIFLFLVTGQRFYSCDWSQYWLIYTGNSMAENLLGCILQAYFVSVKLGFFYSLCIEILAAYSRTLSKLNWMLYQ